jgi:prevent-host-death family protein
MVKTVSAAQANREFSKLLRAAASGERVVVTSRGKAVAEIVPATTSTKADEAEQDAAVEAFFVELAQRPAENFPRATRDDMYD